jgi:hypothetical protein
MVVACQSGLTLVLVIASFQALRDVNRGWEQFAWLQDANWLAKDEMCISWLREQYPQEELRMFQFGYRPIIAYLENRVHLYNIEADFAPLPVASTIPAPDFMQVYPEYALFLDEVTLQRVGAGWNYEPVAGSPKVPEVGECIYRREGAFDYAFVTSLAALQSADFSPQDTQPIQAVQRLPDQIAFDVANGELLIVQINAYPGWQVTVDGTNSAVESVGGVLGVRLPQDGKSHHIVFAYRPPLLLRGAVITLLCAGILIIYLLRS